MRARLDVGDVTGEVKDAITTEPDRFENAKLRVPRRGKNLIGSVGGSGGNGFYCTGSCRTKTPRCSLTLLTQSGLHATS